MLHKLVEGENLLYIKRSSKIGRSYSFTQLVVCPSITSSFPTPSDDILHQMQADFLLSD